MRGRLSCSLAISPNDTILTDKYRVRREPYDIVEGRDERMLRQWR